MTPTRSLIERLVRNARAHGASQDTPDEAPTPGFSERVAARWSRASDVRRSAANPAAVVASSGTGCAAADKPSRAADPEEVGSLLPATTVLQQWESLTARAAGLMALLALLVTLATWHAWPLPENEADATLEAQLAEIVYPS